MSPPRVCGKGSFDNRSSQSLGRYSAWRRTLLAATGHSIAPTEFPKGRSSSGFMEITQSPRVSTSIHPLHLNLKLNSFSQPQPNLFGNLRCSRCQQSRSCSQASQRRGRSKDKLPCQNAALFSLGSPPTSENSLLPFVEQSSSIPPKTLHTSPDSNSKDTIPTPISTDMRDPRIDYENV
ncbi:uncharacterized protein BDR25DRAFT_13038 [Lindgomyces ingoldianus]|uniref:Uncharacterized protein n=1 Tax=Lindgomyces ingoldianus TaxID=673940 RepID=A0ACB6R3T8_9PLEO|nr:uncharacterized protein BDR25DRAFT_13038 [Lindgomyces ingoldianus]KAF2472987.1 hypothetical protein BDR25DRAFT_13038 [Lindgomyces ingoldianus]